MRPYFYDVYAFGMRVAESVLETRVELEREYTRRYGRSAKVKVVYCPAWWETGEFVWDGSGI